MVANEYSFDKFTPQRQEKYLKALEDGYSKQAASRKSGVSDELIRKYRIKYPSFKDKEDEASDTGSETQIDKVETSLYVKCIEGNVTAQIFFLLNRRPHKWRDMRGLQIRSLEDVLNLLPPDIGRQLRERLQRDVSEEDRGIQKPTETEEGTD
jgi:hypothetical protein